MDKAQQEAFTRHYGLPSSFLEKNSHIIPVIQRFDQKASENLKNLLERLSSTHGSVLAESPVLAWSIQQAEHSQIVKKLLTLFEDFSPFAPDPKRNNNTFLDGLNLIIAISKGCSEEKFAQYLDVLIALRLFNQQASVSPLSNLSLSQVAVCNELADMHDMITLKNMIITSGNLYAADPRFLKHPALVAYMQGIAKLKDPKEREHNIQAMSTIIECCCTPQILGDKRNLDTIECILNKAFEAHTPSLMFRSAICQLLRTNALNTAENLSFIFLQAADQPKHYNNLKAFKPARAFLLRYEGANSTPKEILAILKYMNAPLVDIMQKICKTKGLSLEKPSLFYTAIRAMMCGVLGKTLAPYPPIPASFSSGHSPFPS